MAIENIGLFPIEIDLYKKYKVTTVYANEGDKGGRGLAITLVKDNEPIDATGLDLRLGFTDVNGEEKLYDFETVAPLLGKFNISYPEEMLIGQGGKVIKAEIKAYETLNNKLVNYNPLYVYVSKQVVSEGALIESQEGSTLTKMLNDVSYVQEALGNLDQTNIDNVILVNNEIVPMEQARQQAELLRVALYDESLLLEASLNALESEVSGNEEARKTAELLRQTLKQQLETLQSSMTTLESTVSTNEASRIQAELLRRSLYDAMALTQSSITDLENTVMINENARKSAELLRIQLNTELNTLKTELEQAITNVDGVLTVSQTRLTELNNQLSQFNSNTQNILSDEATRKANEVLRKSNEEARIIAENNRNAFISQVNDRIDRIIATPTMVSEQEILDARDGNASLGANIRQVKSDLADNTVAFNRAVSEVTVDSEVILARGLENDTLEERLDKSAASLSALTTDVNAQLAEIENKSLSYDMVVELANGTRNEIDYDNWTQLQKISQKQILNGSMAWTAYSVGTLTYRVQVTDWAIGKNAVLATDNSGIAISEDGDYLVKASAGADVQLVCIGSNNALYIRVDKSKVDVMSGASIIDKVKNYLSAHPVSFYYQHLSPQVVALPDLSINAREILRLSEEITGVTTIENEAWSVI